MCEYSDKNGAADLVQHRSGALLVRRIDDVGFQGIDGGKLVLASVEPELPRVVSRRDHGGVGRVQRGKTCRHCTASSRSEPAQDRLGLTHRVTDR